jgi:hypothetical protein
MGPRETECEGVVWIHLAQDSDDWRVPVKMVMKHCAQQKVGKFLEYLCES